MSSRDRINQELKQAHATAEKLGAVLDIDPEIFIDDDHLDTIWYGGDIGSIRYKGYELTVAVHGDVVLSWQKAGREEYYSNRSNSGAMSMQASDTLRYAFKSDKELLDAIQNGVVEYDENNWVEIFVKGPGEQYCSTTGVIDDTADNVLESMCDVSGWIDLLEKEYIKANSIVKEAGTMREIKTIEPDLYEKAEDGIHLKHVGIISGQELFDRLYNHLKEVGLLPDEYFVFSPLQNQKDELPEFSTAVCHTDWGGNEGIYIDISLESYEDSERKSFPFAVGKTLAQDGDAFLHMSRIAAECSLMLNGRGTIVKISDKHYPDKANEQDKSSLTEQIQSAASRVGETRSIPATRNIETEL